MGLSLQSAETGYNISIELVFISAIGEDVMIRYSVIFFVVAIIAAFFGFIGIAGAAIEIAKFLFYIFIVLFLVSLIMGLMRRGDR